MPRTLPARAMPWKSGDGLHLERGDGRDEELFSGGPAAYFSGEEASNATLLDGPVSDLNVTTRCRCTASALWITTPRCCSAARVARPSTAACPAANVDA